MRYFTVQFAVLTFALAPFLARAGGGEVVVIYNSRLPESKAVAEHYALLRQVPDNQVFGFALTTNEEMSRPTAIREARLSGLRSFRGQLRQARVSIFG